MSKRVIVNVISLFLVGLLPVATSSCQVTAPTPAVETRIVTVVETVVETVEVEKTSPYTYQLLREMSDTGVYAGKPARGHVIAFANIDGQLPYASLVRQGITDEWQSAGGFMEDLIIFDNMAESDKALENAQAVFDAGPEVFLQFQADPNANALIGKGASDNGIFIIALEIPVPGYPLIGIDNFGASVMAGEWAAEKINNSYGGWDNIDRVIYLDSSGTGERTALRIFGAKYVLGSRFGSSAHDRANGSKAVVFDGIIDADRAGLAMQVFLQDYPEDEFILVFCINDSAAQGVYQSAVEAGRWDAEKWILVSHGLDDRGRELVRSGIIDADIAYFPENYGKYAVPAALSHIYGNAVPPYIFIENEVITEDNIGLYYPSG